MERDPDDHGQYDKSLSDHCGIVPCEIIGKGVQDIVTIQTLEEADGQATDSEFHAGALQ